MGRRPCCSKEGLNRGAWTAMEDKILTSYIKAHGEGKWRNLPKRAGLKRCGKSCRLRWLNYLRPDIKRGNISDDEEELIIRLHRLLGNRWSLIAGRLPGRTDNEIKNYWNTTLRKKGKAKSSSLPPPPLDPLSPSEPTLNQVIRTKATRCTRVILPSLCPLSTNASNSATSELQPRFFTVSDDSNGGPEKETPSPDRNFNFLESDGSKDGTDGGYDYINEFYVDPQQCLPLEEPIFKDWTFNYTEENSSFDLDSFVFLLDPQVWP